VFAVIFGLFSSEIKENYSNYHGARTVGILHTKDGLAPGGRFFGVGGQGVQLTSVGASPDSRVYNGQKYNLNFKRALGYQTDQAFPPMKENFSVEQQCLKTGVDAGRNMQTAPPPKFMVTGPKLESYRPTDPNFMGVNFQKPIDHAEDLVVSQFGQVQMDARKSNAQSIKENYDTYATASVDLPKDMCNVNMLGSESQPVIYDRVMYSNIRSRNRGQGDYIRGDLMIAPDNYKPNGGGHPQWFQVSAKPERDLNPGCMEHLFGRKEEISLGLAEADIDVASFGL
jgi:hypothetical protein